MVNFTRAFFPVKFVYIFLYYKIYDLKYKQFTLKGRVLYFPHATLRGLKFYSFLDHKEIEIY